MHVFCAEDCVH